MAETHHITHQQKSTDATKQKTLTIELQHVDFAKRYSVTLFEKYPKNSKQQGMCIIVIYNAI